MYIYTYIYVYIHICICVPICYTYCLNISFFEVCVNRLVSPNNKYWQKHFVFQDQWWRVMAVWNLIISTSQITENVIIPYVFQRFGIYPRICPQCRQCRKWAICYRSGPPQQAPGVRMTWVLTNSLKLT